LIASLCALVRFGVPLTTASRALEIPDGSLRNWLRWVDDEGPNQALYQELASAVADAQMERERNVARAVEQARKHALAPAVRRAPGRRS
jgi:hypothetical protein